MADSSPSVETLAVEAIELSTTYQQLLTVSSDTPSASPISIDQLPIIDLKSPTCSRTGPTILHTFNPTV